MSDDGYGAADYDAMFADPVRTDAYLAAIRQVVGPGDIVVEIGTGVGYFAIAAAQAGARHVYAIEREPAIALAERLVHENGCADRITCLRGDSRRLELPERGTVLLSDLRGLTPLFGDAIPTIAAARERLLAPGARCIGRRDVVFAAPCSAPRDWRERELGLGDSPRGISRRAAAAVARAALHRDRVTAGDLLADGAVVVTIDYATVESPDVDVDLEWTVGAGGVAEGLVLWFEATLADGISFSTSPGLPRTVYGNGFLPFSAEVSVAAGDRLRCHLRAKLVDGAYVFAWDTCVVPKGADVPGPATRQSTLAGLLAPAGDLARRRASHRPTPDAFADVRRLLELVDGERSQGEIAAAVRREQPGRFRSDAAALAWVSATLIALEDAFPSPG